jgi:hypothetical protein
MQEIELIIGFIQSIGFTGLLIILAIPSLREKIFGGGNGQGTEILEHLQNYYNHDLTAFMSQINTKVQKLDEIEKHLEDIRLNGVRLRK